MANTDNRVAIDITANDLADAALNKTISKINQVATATEKANARAKASQANLDRAQQRQLAAARQLRKAQFDQLKPEQQMIVLKERQIQLERLLGRERISQARRYSLMAAKAQADMAIMQMRSAAYSGPVPPVLGRAGRAVGGGRFNGGGLMSLLGAGRFGGMIGQFGAGGMIAGAVGAGIGGIFRSAMSDQREAQAGRLSLDELAGIKSGARQNNIDPGEITKAYGNFQGSAATAQSSNRGEAREMANAFKTLGISMDTLTSGKSFQQFTGLLQGLAKGSEDPKKMAAAMLVLGGDIDKIVQGIRNGLGGQIAKGSGMNTQTEIDNVANAGKAAKGFFGRAWDKTKAAGITGVNLSMGMARMMAGGAANMFLSPFGRGGKAREWHDAILPNLASENSDPELRANLERQLAENKKKKYLKDQAAKRKQFSMLSSQRDQLLSDWMGGPGIRNDPNANVGLYTSGGSAAYAQSAMAIQRQNLQELKRVNDNLIAVKDSLDKTLTGEDE